MSQSSPAPIQRKARLPRLATPVVRDRRGEPVERTDLQKLVASYFWFILKNVIGWLMIIAAPILGIALPGPGGIPVFLIGFALVTFPGKRRLTSRFMRGRRLPIESPLFTGLITFLSVLVTGTLMLLVWRYYEWLGDELPLRQWRLDRLARLIAVCVLALPVTMLVAWIGLKVLNGLLSWVPRLRRMVRPALRRFGVQLLPTRRKRIGGGTRMVEDEILTLDEGQRQRLQRAWLVLGPWLKRLVTVTLTIGIIWFLVLPVIREWGAVQQRIGRANALRLVAAVAMYAVGLFLFGAVTWRVILGRFGQRMPLRAAVRIWALGHLMRYIPGRFYQLLRMEMARPYGVTAMQASVATRLEGVLMLMGALLVGVVAFWLMVYMQFPAWRPVLIVLAAISPLALVLTAPSIFYRIMPPATGVWRHSAHRTRLSGAWVLALAVWLTLGLLWQGMAVWLLVGPPLQVGGHWWIIAGAWSLAWAAGHLAPWAPGGLGVREIVFVGALSVLLPPQLRESFASSIPFTLFAPETWQDVWWAFLIFLALLLRIATTAGEFLLGILATALDWRGMMRLARR